MFTVSDFQILICHRLVSDGPVSHSDFAWKNHRILVVVSIICNICVVCSFHKNDRSDISADASILSSVERLSYAKDLISDICGQHLNNSQMHKY